MCAGVPTRVVACAALGACAPELDWGELSAAERRFAYLRQNPGVNTTSRVNNSSRPSNIAMVQIQIWKSFSAA